MSEPDSSAAARCRWLGPTPPMVVWWYRHPCPLLEHFAQYYRRPRSPLAVQASLKPLGAIAEAHSRQAVVGDWALLTANDDRVPGNTRAQDLAFSTVEATQAFGGLPKALATCQACPANVPANVAANDPTNVPANDPANVPANTSSDLAGCSQWWMFGDLSSLSQQTRRLTALPQPLPRPPWLAGSVDQQPRALLQLQETLFAQASWRNARPSTSPLATWQAWWHPGQTRQTLAGPLLLQLAEALPATRAPSKSTATAVTANAADANSESESESESSSDSRWDSQSGPSATEPLSGWAAFCRAIQWAAERGDTIETEYVPAGFSDGHDWWLTPHCSRCGAAMASDQRQCSVCGKAGGPVPEQKRRIMGWAPYRPLALLVDAATRQQLLLDLTKPRSV